MKRCFFGESGESREESKRESGKVVKTNVVESKDDLKYCFYGKIKIFFVKSTVLLIKS